MKKDFLPFLIACFICSCISFQAYAQEKVFATYFDIPVNSPEGTEVTGRIHLERNKDVLTSPIPKGYKFEIVTQPAEALFKIETRYDLSQRIMGILSVDKKKKTGPKAISYPMTIALKNGNREIEKFDITVHIAKSTLWTLLYDRYLPHAIGNSRLYGRMKYSDKEVAEIIDELEKNNGRFSGFRCYTARPQDYKAEFNPKNDHLNTKTIEYGWEK